MPSPVAFAVPKRAVTDVTAYLADLEPDRITTSQAAELSSLFAELARLGSAGQTLVARRAAQGERWKAEGHRSAASWIARAAGTGLGEAKGLLETGERLERLPATTQALRRGELSGTQVREIAAAASSRPSTEAELLEVAGSGTIENLKDRCRRVRAVVGSAQAERDRYAAIHAARFFRHWSDPDGAFRGEFRLAPDHGARLLAAVEGRANDLFDEARRAERREPPTAYQADALVDLVTGSPADTRSRGRDRAVLHVRADIAALRRGYVEGGEVCEIPGVGPVPVATATSVLPHAFLKILVTDGVDVLSVAHAKRTIGAHLRSAIEERDRSCVVPGCDVACGLEIDHWHTDFAADGPTALHNLATLCHFHHFQKTYRGFVLSGGPGRWEWEPPPELDSG
jgi:hypothetical protein